MKNISIYSNISYCYLKLKMYEDAFEYANLALHIDSMHQLSLFRKAQALIYLFEFEQVNDIYPLI